jgi:hypothetical protein
MHQTITTENHIGDRKWTGDQIDAFESTKRIPEEIPIPLHHFINHIRPNIPNAGEIHIAHPVKVPTGNVENTLDAQLADELWKPLPYDARLEPSRTRARQGLCAYKAVVAVDGRKI